LNTRSPVIVDVDTGVDDAIALALAVELGVNLLGVTTVAGNVPIDVATQNTSDVLAYLGATNVPVHRGASRPLTATYQDATHVHGGNGLGGVELPVSTRAEEVLPGPAFILKSAEEHAGELVLVTLGPLTNLAIALNVRPGLVDQVAKLIVMGGAYLVPGNVTPHAEFNVYVDPHAADQVFNASWRGITLVGLDVTHQTVFSRERWDGIAADAQGAAALVRSIMQRTFTDRAMSGFYLHDPLALAVALNPDLVSGEEHTVSVDTTEEFRGKTAAVPGRGPLVATRVDAPAFLEILSGALGLPHADDAKGFERAE
jgi:inosine-uridine nucleoside N-ribohydrolase